jgi:hypothetical protein
MRHSKVSTAGIPGKIALSPGLTFFSPALRIALPSSFSSSDVYMYPVGQVNLSLGHAE